MEWQSYEELVKNIYQELGKATGVQIECWGSTCKVLGQSGVSHQIDILTSHSDGIHTYKTAIECKFWDKKISKDVVFKLSEILTDAKLDKGVVVSKSGFTESAKAIANTKNIKLVQLREPVAADWDRFVCIKKISIDLCLAFDEVFNYRAAISNVDEDQKESFSDAGVTLKIEVRNKGTISLHEIADKYRKCLDTRGKDSIKNTCGWVVTASVNKEIRTYVVKFPKETFVVHPTTGHKANISELEFSVRENIISKEIQIDYEDRVAWIMEAIFEKTVFAISHDHVPMQLL
ncbi:MAG: restriction endonuclease [Gammaproteobacteria bacterium]|nr:restriction endonuclease [Gammaproteobacteria bacterium]